jgi:hypothetical protein
MGTPDQKVVLVTSAASGISEAVRVSVRQGAAVTLPASEEAALMNGT